MSNYCYYIEISFLDLTYFSVFHFYSQSDTKICLLLVTQQESNQHHSILQWRKTKQSKCQRTFHSVCMIDHRQFYFVERDL